METHIYVPAELGITIREARKTKGYRQEDLAVDRFLSTGTISKIERGSVHVGKEKVGYLCEKLGINMQIAGSYDKEKDELDPSLKLLSIENHLNMVSIDEAWDELKRIRTEEELHRVWILYLKGRYYEKKGKKQQAKGYYLQVAEIDDPEVKESNFAAASYHALGRICFYEDRMEEALNYVEKGLSTYQIDSQRVYVIHFLKISQIIYLEKLNRNEEALVLLDKMWTEKTEIESSEVILSMYEMKAELFNKLGRYDEAIDIATEGLSKARINRMPSRSSVLWTTLGECYCRQEKLNQAEFCFQTALSMKKEIKEEYIIILLYLKLGNISRQRGNTEQAFEMYTNAYKIAETSRDQVRFIETLITLGDYLIQTGKEIEAKKLYLRGLQIELVTPEQQGQLYMRLAKCSCKNNKEEYYYYLDKFYQLYDQQHSS